MAMQIKLIVVVVVEQGSSQLIFQFKHLERRSLKKSGIAEVTGANPVKAPIFFFSSFFFPIV